MRRPSARWHLSAKGEPVGYLDGKVAVITGAGRGLGRAHAIHMASEGARVVVNDFGRGTANDGDDAGVANEVADLINAQFPGHAVSHTGDVAEEAGAESLVNAALDQFGSLDIVVNNAGNLRDRTVVNMSYDEWDQVVRVHGRGTFGVCRAALRHFKGIAKETGAPVSSVIVNTTSEAGIYGGPGQANYSFAKAGIVSLSLVIHRELNRYGIRCNAVSPRARTRMTDQAFGDLPGLEDELDPWAPEHVSPLVTWLASDASAPVSGQVFVAWSGNVHVVEQPQFGPGITEGDEPISTERIDEFYRAHFAENSPVPLLGIPDMRSV